MSSIKKLAIEPTGTMDVRDVEGNVVEENGQKWSITFHSPGTKEFQKAKHAFDEKRSNSVTALMTGKSDAKRGAEDDTREVAEFLAACTVSLNGFDYEGKPGYEGIKAMFMDIEIGHVADAANKFLGDRANFLKSKQPILGDTSDKLPG